MSFLVEALNKSNNSNDNSNPTDLTGEPQDINGLFANDSADELRLKKIKQSLFLFLVILITFVAGYWLAVNNSHNEINPNATLKPLETTTVAKADNGNEPADMLGGEKRQKVVDMSEAVVSSHLINATDKPRNMTLTELEIPQLNQKRANHFQDNFQDNPQDNLVSSNNEVQLAKPTAVTESKKSVEQINNPWVNVVNRERNQLEVNSKQSFTSSAESTTVTNNKSSANLTSNPSAALTGISPELLQQFNAAVAETMALSDSEIDMKNELNVPKLTELSSEFQLKIPSLNFQTHIYSSEEKQRWVKVNGNIVREGQVITDDILLNKIEPQNVVLDYKGTLFALPALSNW